MKSEASILATEPWSELRYKLIFKLVISRYFGIWIWLFNSDTYAVVDLMWRPRKHWYHRYVKKRRKYERS